MDMPVLETPGVMTGVLADLDRRPSPARRRVDVLGSPIDALRLSEAVERILAWGVAHESRTVCACNVHSVIQSRRDARLRRAVRGADLVLADGAPVAWLMRRLGADAQQRIAGPDLMSACIGAAAERGQSIFLYGSTEETLTRLEARLRERFPRIVIAGTHAPAFDGAGPAIDESVIERINASGAGTVWVALGCPKQEAWIDAHRDRIRAVMVGVGAAFDFHAGSVRRAPPWMQRRGLEWLHRLVSEPRRLWRRYLVTNTTFIALLAPTLIARALHRSDLRAETLGATALIDVERSATKHR